MEKSLDPINRGISVKNILQGAGSKKLLELACAIQIHELQRCQHTETLSMSLR